MKVTILYMLEDNMTVFYHLCQIVVAYFQLLMRIVKIHEKNKNTLSYETTQSILLLSHWNAYQRRNLLLLQLLYVKTIILQYENILLILSKTC